eukprot:gb/GEZN01012849.1/.p1 GENE.gb/GEZN01012849.1/~~gb/GEZN01012849.1/.p1  ORF type:complete len:240 (+),score=31.51 gb/GEZN01012849.1/:54-722(+)
MRIDCPSGGKHWRSMAIKEAAWSNPDDAKESKTKHKKARKKTAKKEVTEPLSASEKRKEKLTPVKTQLSYNDINADCADGDVMTSTEHFLHSLFVGDACAEDAGRLNMQEPPCLVNHGTGSAEGPVHQTMVDSGGNLADDASASFPDGEATAATKLLHVGDASVEDSRLNMQESLVFVNHTTESAPDGVDSEVSRQELVEAAMPAVVTDSDDIIDIDTWVVV